MQQTGWERIYRQKGDLQFDVLPKIKRYAAVFKEKGYQKILDLGCGTGRHSLFLAGEGFQVYATDNSATGIKIARQKAESMGINTIQFKQHDMKEIPFADDFFDAVICVWTIYHGTLSDVTRTFGDIFRVLRPGGTFITDFLSIDDYSYGLGREIERHTFVGAKKEEEDVPHHYFDREDLVQLFAGYREVEIEDSSRSYQTGNGEAYVRVYYDVEAIK